MHSLRGKLIFPFIIGMILLTFALVAQTYMSAYRSMEDAVLTISEAKTNSAVSSINMLFKTLNSRAQHLVSDPLLISALREVQPSNPEVVGNSVEKEALDDEKTSVQRASEWLESLQEGNRYFRDIMLMDTNGTCIASSNVSYINTNFKDEQCVQLAMEGVFNFANFTIGKVTKTFSAYFAGPIDVHGTIEGILLVVVDFPKIVDYETKDSFDSNTILTSMLDANGVFMANPDTKIMGNTKHTYPELYRQLADIGELGGAVKYKMEAGEYVGYAKLEPNSHWVVVTSGLKRVVFASPYRMGITVFCISCLFLCIIASIVIWQVNGVMSMLISLINYAKRVSEGKLDLHLNPTDRRDELGILHSSLDRLVTVLQSMIRQTESANKAKGEFLANMSHEMRTPLNAVIGMAHLAGQPDTTPEKQKTYLRRIQVAARSLLAVINDILDISKIEAGKITLDSAPFDVRQLLSDINSIHYDNAKTKHIEFAVECADDVHNNYIGDSVRIGQILNNLVGNAIKFTSEGSVKVKCWKEKMLQGSDAHGEQERVYFSVVDTGVGISDEVKARLFSPFTQADASITRRYGGTGLGLAISKQLTGLMHGKIWLDSTPGKGSTFTLYIPMQIANDDALQNRMPLPEASKKEIIAAVKGSHLMLAEDQPINQIIFQELLSSYELDVTTVADGQQAVDAVKNKVFDMILMDMQMPVMDGMEATRVIRTMPNGQSPIIIALTANARDEDKAQGLACGMNDYLTKPVDPEVFASVITSWLTRKNSGNNKKHDQL